MSDVDGNGPYRLEGGATYDRIAQLEAELAAIRASAQPQMRALAELHIRHLREDQSELIAQFAKGRGRLHLATGTMMVTTFALFLVGLWRFPLGTAARIACAMAVTLIAAVGTVSQSVVRAHFRSRYRRLQRRIEEEYVLAGLEARAAVAALEPGVADPFAPQGADNSLGAVGASVTRIARTFPGG